MKVRAIRVNQWTRFNAPSGIEGLGDGLNVLIAPNESGKSSLVEALKTALFTRHSTGGKAFERFINSATGNAPVVEVDFEVDGQAYRVRKRFIRSAYASLSLPGGAEKQGESAEAHLSELLGHTYPQRGMGSAATMGLWGLLWVDQGAAFQAIEAAEGAQRTVMEALESVVGNLLGGEQGRRLPAMIREELGRLLTASTQRPTGTYKEAIARKDALQTELQAMQADLARFEADLQAYEQVRRDLLARQDAGELVALENEIAEANERLTELAALEAQISAASSDLVLRERSLEQAAGAAQRRATLLAEIEALSADLAQRRRQIDEALEEEHRLASLLADARSAEKRAGAFTAEAIQAKREADRIMDAARAQRELSQLQLKLRDAEEAAEGIADLQARIALNKATEARVDQISASNTAVSAAAGAGAAAATLIDFEWEPGGERRVTVSCGSTPEHGARLQVIDATRIVVEGIGAFTVRPQIQDAQELQGNLDRAQGVLSAALAEIGAADVPDAVRMGRQRSADAQALREAQFRLDHIAPSEQGGVAGIRAGRDAARAQLDALKASGLCMDTLPALAEAQASQEEATRAAEAAEAAARNATAAVASARDVLVAHRDLWQQPRATLEQKVYELQSREKSLEAEMPSAELEQLIAAAKQAVAEQRVIVASLVAQQGADSTEQMRARVNRFSQARDSLVAEVSRLGNRKSALEATLSRDGAAGLSTRIADKERELAFATAHHDRMARDAKVLGLLNTVLGEAEREARDRFMGPISSKMTPYLRTLFPGAEIELDESLGIRSLRRVASDDSSFEKLSLGTQEQINIIARIAIAELLAEQGKPCMVIVDDGLAYADDERMGRMFDILNMAAERVQVLLLSCHAGAFGRAGGKLLSLQEFADRDTLATA